MYSQEYIDSMIRGRVPISFENGMLNSLTIIKIGLIYPPYKTENCEINDDLNSHGISIIFHAKEADNCYFVGNVEMAKYFQFVLKRFNRSISEVNTTLIKVGGLKALISKEHFTFQQIKE